MRAGRENGSQFIVVFSSQVSVEDLSHVQCLIVMLRTPSPNEIIGRTCADARMFQRCRACTMGAFPTPTKDKSRVWQHACWQITTSASFTEWCSTGHQRARYFAEADGPSQLAPTCSIYGFTRASAHRSLGQQVNQSCVCVTLFSCRTRKDSRR